MIMIYVIIGERQYKRTSWNGVMVRSLINPGSGGATSGSVFEVRSSGYAPRLWCGQDITSVGSNKLCFGFNNANGAEGRESNYIGKIDTDGSIDRASIEYFSSVNCSEINVNSTINSSEF